MHNAALSALTPYATSLKSELGYTRRTQLKLDVTPTVDSSSENALLCYCAARCDSARCSFDGIFGQLIGACSFLQMRLGFCQHGLQGVFRIAT